ncbi:MAG TPA: hypothetical protein DCE41_36270, partial [Cytophagales bacterium]|nr:hypothetical protein [Cytophagales bacterium]
MDKVALLEKKLQRERAARKEAERLLEEKSLQLYHANQQLRHQYAQLKGKAGTTEQALEETQGRYEMLVDQVHDFVFKTDPQGMFSYVNSACTRILGYHPRDLLGHSYTKIIFPDDRQRVIDFYRNPLALSQENYLEFKVYAQDGTMRWIGQKVRMAMKGGELFEIVGVARDITAEKQAQIALGLSEEKYRGIMENMQLGLLEVDNDDIIVRAFPAFCDMTGYVEEELLGKDANEVFLDEKNLAIMQAANEERRDGKHSVYEIQIKKKDGTQFWVLISGAPIKNSDEEVIGSIGIHYDLSDRKALEVDLKRAQEAAEHARQAEKQFLANMSHEIRNPINAMVGMVNLLYDTPLNADQTEYLDTVKYASELLLSLISGVLDIAKIEAGELETHTAPFDLQALCQSVIGTMSYQAHEKGIGLVFDYRTNFETQLIGDAKFVNQILVNLLSNAAKFTSEGEIGLATSVLKTDGLVHWVQFEVWDTGIGIPEDELPHIFERFKQAGNDTKVRYGGTG